MAAQVGGYSSWQVIGYSADYIEISDHRQSGCLGKTVQNESHGCRNILCLRCKLSDSKVSGEMLLINGCLFALADHAADTMYQGSSVLKDIRLSNHLALDRIGTTTGFNHAVQQRVLLLLYLDRRNGSSISVFPVRQYALARSDTRFSYKPSTPSCRFSVATC